MMLCNNGFDHFNTCSVVMHCRHCIYIGSKWFLLHPGSTRLCVLLHLILFCLTGKKLMSQTVVGMFTDQLIILCIIG